MSTPNTSEKSNDLDRQENLTRGQLSAKKVVLYTYDASTDTLIPSGNPLAYGINNITSDATYKYFGFETADGQWKIMRKTLADGTFQYAKGDSGYSTAWTNKATQTYANYGDTF